MNDIHYPTKINILWIMRERRRRFIFAGYYDWGGTLLISFSFDGHSTTVSRIWKQLPVASRYCKSDTFSGVGYTIIERVSGTTI
jgi:hypothetical protein